MPMMAMNMVMVMARFGLTFVWLAGVAAGTACFAALAAGAVTAWGAAPCGAACDAVGAEVAGALAGSAAKQTVARTRVSMVASSVLIGMGTSYWISVTSSSVRRSKTVFATFV